jgi:hypothetical protein
MRGDLSAPVLAIIVTIGIIAAGLVLLAWFWWFAPSAGKAGTLQVMGQPSLINATEAKKIIMSVRNTGNDYVNITRISVKDSLCNLGTNYIILNPGESKVIELSLNPTTCVGGWEDITIGATEYTVQGIIYTNYGTFTVNFAVIKP